MVLQLKDRCESLSDDPWHTIQPLGTGVVQHGCTTSCGLIFVR